MRKEIGRDEQVIAADRNIAEREYWLEKLSGNLHESRFQYDGKKTAAEILYEVVEHPFAREIIPGLLQQSSGSDRKIHVILAAAAAILLEKYTGNKDIILCTPIYNPGQEGNFINTLLPLRIRLEDDITFRELLKQVARAILEAAENQNYPMEILFAQLNQPLTGPGAIPGVALLLENIHRRDHLYPLTPELLFSFLRTGDTLQIRVEYRADLYEPGTIQAVIGDFEKLLRQAIMQMEIKLSGLQIPGIEAKRRPRDLDDGTGKENRQENKTPAKAFVAPRNAKEKKLRRIWAEILEIDETTISIDDYFFQLDANSLKAIMLTSMIHKEFNAGIPLEKIFEIGTVRQLAGYLEGARENRYASIEPAEKKEYYRLSSAQKRLYILHNMDDLQTVYNVPLLYVWNRELDKVRFKETMQRMVERHESLRTSFIMINNETLQKVHPPQDSAFEIEYYKAGKEEAREIIRNFIRPFDLSKLPLMRVGLVEVDNAGHYILLLDLHHIITDASSRVVFIKEFMSLYHGEELPPLRLQYKDYTEWQNTAKQQAVINRQEDYWLKQFAGDLPCLNLPIDYPRGRKANFKGNFFYFEIDDRLTSAINERVKLAEVTLNIFLLAVYNILISRYTGQQDIVVGTVISGRPHTDLENIIGFFINLLALRNRPEEQKTFTEFLGEVRQTAINAYDRQDYPFEELVARLKIQRQPGRHPLVETVLTFHDADIEPGEDVGAGEEDTTRAQYAFDYKISHFDLLLHVTPGKNRLNMAFEYSNTLFKMSTIEIMARHSREILEQVVENPGILIKDLKISHHLAVATVNILKTDDSEFVF